MKEESDQRITQNNESTKEQKQQTLFAKNPKNRLEDEN
jgi:hypothetical protein